MDWLELGEKGSHSEQMKEVMKFLALLAKMSHLLFRYLVLERANETNFSSII